MKKNLVLFLFFLSYSISTLAQEKRWNVGLAFDAGFSRSSDSKFEDFVNTNLEVYAPLSSSSVTGYAVWKFRKFNIDKTPIFQYFRVSLGYSNRGGIYEINNTPSKVSFSYVDFDVMVPLNYRISDVLNIYFGVGGMLSFVVSQTEDSPKSNSIHPGLFAEMGISTIRGSYFAFQLLGTYSDYSVQNLALTFGVTIGEAKASKQIR